MSGPNSSVTLQLQTVLESTQATLWVLLPQLFAKWALQHQLLCKCAVYLFSTETLPAGNWTPQFCSPNSDSLQIIEFHSIMDELALLLHGPLGNYMFRPSSFTTMMNHLCYILHDLSKQKAPQNGLSEISRQNCWYRNNHPHLNARITLCFFVLPWCSCWSKILVAAVQWCQFSLDPSISVLNFEFRIEIFGCCRCNFKFWIIWSRMVSNFRSFFMYLVDIVPVWYFLEIRNETILPKYLWNYFAEIFRYTRACT